MFLPDVSTVPDSYPLAYPLRTTLKIVYSLSGTLQRLRTGQEVASSDAQVGVNLLSCLLLTLRFALPKLRHVVVLGDDVQLQIRWIPLELSKHGVLVDPISPRTLVI